MKKISLVGEPPMTLSEAPGVYGGSWGPEDTIVFAGRTESGQGLHLVSAAGGEPEILINTDFEKGEIQYRRPEFLPGGKAVLFSIRGDNGFQLAALSLATREKKIVLEGAREAHYSPTGHLVYVVPETGTLSAVLFDPERLEVIGEPVPVLEGIREDPDGSVDYSFSSEGTLIYVPAGAAIKGVPVWVDREGTVMESLVEESLQNPQGPRLSPDGRRLVVAINPGDGSDLWVYDLAGRPPYPLTVEGRNSYPLWSPDGQRVVFRSVGGGSRMLLQVAADGTTLNPELLLSSPRNWYPTSWSADGQELIFLDAHPDGASLMSLPVEGQQEPRLLFQTQYAFRPGQHGASAALSPDGRWLAYVSGVTGGPEIWVRPYPGPGAPLRISPGGGLEVVWGPEGRELFYLEGDKMMAVKIETEPTFHFQPPELLFEGGFHHANPSYDIGPDGRFLMIKLTEEPRGQINIVLNWFEELKRLVPAN
jgi:Tol biopolymer transport system component